MDPEQKQSLLEKIQEQVRQSPFLKMRMGVYEETVSGIEDTGIKTYIFFFT